MNLMKKSAAFAALVALSAPSFAVDIVAAQTELGEGLTNVTAIGGAVLVIGVTIAVFKYVKKAF